MNEVIVRVRAMNITPTRPPRLSPWAEALSRKFGRRISNRPSRLRPKTRNSAATPKLSQGLLASLDSDAAPKKTENSRPSAVKIPMIDRQ